MITRRFFVSGMLTTTAVISASQFLPTPSAPQPYATVVGIGWDNEVIEHVIYEPISVAHFGGTPAIDKFKQVTDWVYAFEVEPLPETYRNPRGAYAIDPSIKWAKPIEVQENGFTNIVGPQALHDWQESLRPDLGGRTSVEWVQEQLDGYRKFGGEPSWLTDGLRGKSNV